MSDITQSPAFKRFSKIMYLKIIQEELRKDPTLWLKFSHEKQVELHAIRKEIDEYYVKEITQ